MQNITEMTQQVFNELKNKVELFNERKLQKQEAIHSSDISEEEKQEKLKQMDLVELEFMQNINEKKKEIYTFLYSNGICFDKEVIFDKNLNIEQMYIDKNFRYNLKITNKLKDIISKDRIFNVQRNYSSNVIPYQENLLILSLFIKKNRDNFDSIEFDDENLKHIIENEKDYVLPINYSKTVDTQRTEFMENIIEMFADIPKGTPDKKQKEILEKRDVLKYKLSLFLKDPNSFYITVSKDSKNEASKAICNNILRKFELYDEKKGGIDIDRSIPVLKRYIEYIREQSKKINIELNSDFSYKLYDEIINLHHAYIAKTGMRVYTDNNLGAVDRYGGSNISVVNRVYAEDKSEIQEQFNKIQAKKEKSHKEGFELIDVYTDETIEKISGAIPYAMYLPKYSDNKEDIDRLDKALYSPDIFNLFTYQSDMEKKCDFITSLSQILIDRLKYTAEELKHQKKVQVLHKISSADDFTGMSF